MSDEYSQESHIDIGRQMQSFINRILVRQNSNYTKDEITNYVKYNTNLKFKMEEVSRLGTKVWYAKAQAEEKYRNAMERLNEAELALNEAELALTETKHSILQSYGIQVGAGTRKRRKRRKTKRKKTKRRKINKRKTKRR